MRHQPLDNPPNRAISGLARAHRRAESVEQEPVNGVVKQRNLVSATRKPRSTVEGDVWLFGGSALAARLSPLGDRLILKFNPVVVHQGIRLWAGAFRHRALRLRSSGTFSSGVVWLDYECR